MSNHLRRRSRSESRTIWGANRARLLVSSLEERLAPAIFNVTTDAENGAGSLRQAITDANGATGGIDTINFSTFFNQARTISLQSALPVISDSVVINGVGPNLLTVQRDPAAATQFRIFEVNGTSAVINVTIAGMTVTGGNPTGASGSGPLSDGGGVLLYSDNLTLLNMNITGNSATEGGGVGVANLASGGAGFLTVRNCTISGNTANGSPNPSFGGSGGGIYFANRGSLLVENSTISGNTSTNFTGGGIYFFGQIGAGGFTIRNSTITGNTAATSAGGIYIGGIVGTVNVQNSTIIGNTANGTLGTQGGGGIGFFRTTGTLSLVSSVIANNTIGVGATGPDMVGRVNQSFSLIRDETGATITNEGNNLLAGTDPLFDAAGLASNGGPTQTIALQAASPLLNAGSNPGSQAFDQRGPGFPRAVGQPDIGAFELRPAGTPAASGTFANVTMIGVATYTFQVTYSSPTSPINVSTIDDNDIRVQGPNGFNSLATRVSVDPSDPSNVIVTYSVAAPGGGFTPATNGGYSISVEQSQVQNNIPLSVPAGAIGSFQVLVPSTFTVTNTADDGAGSLRNAIAQSNATSTPDFIVFGSLFNTAQTITLSTDQLLITDATTITGPGPNLLTIARDAAAATQFRLFEINVPGVADVTLSGIRLTGGSTIGTSGTGAGGDGGAILFYDENLTLNGMGIVNNTSGTEGGAIANASRLNANGGAGFLTLRNSTVSGNSATGPIGGSGFGGGGGGVYFANGGSLLIENSTISGNTSTNFEGGGLYFFGPVGGPGLAIRNSTIVGNTAGVNGGGLSFATINATALIENSTIANNTANGLAGDEGGGGIGFFGTTGAVSITNTVIANNTVSPTGAGPDVLGAVTASFSLIRDQSGAVITDGGNLLAAGTDPLFDPAGIATNGGPTQTLALEATSPLVNAGTTTVPGVQFDQRGSPFARVVGAAADIGAFEVQGGGAAPTVTSTTVNGGATQRSRVTTIDVTFSTQVTFAGPVASAFTLTRMGGGSVNFTATANVVAGATVVTLNSFTGAETESGSLRDGRYTLTALANQISAGGTNMAANFTFGDLQGLFRFYGDMTADRRVDIADFGFFSLAYLTQANYNPVLDFNQDTRIDIADFGQFSVRYFTTLP